MQIDMGEMISWEARRMFLSTSNPDLPWDRRGGLGLVEFQTCFYIGKYLGKIWDIFWSTFII